MTLPPHADVRDCRLYRIRVYHPDDMMLPAEQRRVVLGYIGETARMPLARLIEHIMDQPWSDMFVGYDVDPRVFAGKAAVLEAERMAVAAELPLYNYEWNLGNPDRIEIWRAQEQRALRDAVRAVERRWTPPAVRGGSARVQACPPARAPAQPKVKPWPRWRKHLVGWSINWAVLTLSGWISFVVKHQGGWKQCGAMAAVLSGILVGLLARWVWLGCPVTKKQRRRAARRARR